MRPIYCPDRDREEPVGLAELLLGDLQVEVADELGVAVGAPLEDRLAEVQAVVEALRRAGRAP